MSNADLPLNTTIDDLAYVAFPTQRVRRIMVFLHGRGERDQRTMLYPWEQRVVDAGSVFCYPYYGPWSWTTPGSATTSTDLSTTFLSFLMPTMDHNSHET